MTGINPEIIGKRLRDLRGERSQAEIADAVGVTGMAISQYERGERVPSDNVKLKLAELFDVRVDLLFYC